MEKLLYIVMGILILHLLYKAFMFFLFLRLTAKLKDGDMNTFINVLGENYQKRHLLNGLTRYKWSNGLMIVKAGFDESGNLVCNKIMPRIIFRFKSELLFSSRV